MKIDPGAIQNVISYQEIIREAAINYRLPASLMMAICYVESRGNADAFNPTVKATGLFQVVPKEAGPEFEDRPTIEELRDPKTNAEWGCIILDWFRRVEGGSVVWGAFRYSGGIRWFNHVRPDVRSKFENYSDVTQLRKAKLAFDVFLRIYWSKVVAARSAIISELRHDRSP